MLYPVQNIENFRWKFPKKKRHIRLKNMTTSELESIRKVVRNHPNRKEWFAIPSDEWFDNVTYYLKYRRKDRQITEQLGK